jgi:hypothetical protein
MDLPSPEMVAFILLPSFWQQSISGKLCCGFSLGKFTFSKPLIGYNSPVSKSIKINTIMNR